jgi:hypothetical protein
MYIPRLPPGLSPAFWLAALILLLVEATLHSDDIVHRYRSVFAVGRAMDKILFVERQPPTLLFLGNSRVDNGIDPRTVGRFLRLPEAAAFNLGVPGANAVILHGILARLDRAGLLGGKNIDKVVIGLDESTMQADDSLGYGLFVADRSQLWRDGWYRTWLASWLRLWGYSDNLRQLREPEKSLRFLEASIHVVEPVGGGAAQFRGYRAGFEGGQNREQIQRQEAGTRAPPDPVVLAAFWRALDLLRDRKVQAAVVFMPMLNRQPLYLQERPVEARPYRAILDELHARGVPVITRPLADLAAEEFINPGHLNDRGAQRFSKGLAESLRAAWRE